MKHFLPLSEMKFGQKQDSIALLRELRELHNELGTRGGKSESVVAIKF